MRDFEIGLLVLQGVCVAIKSSEENLEKCWCDEEMRHLVKEKTKLIEVYLQNRCNVDREACNSEKRDVKRKVRVKQKKAEERYGKKPVQKV